MQLRSQLDASGVFMTDYWRERLGTPLTANASTRHTPFVVGRMGVLRRDQPVLDSAVQRAGQPPRNLVERRHRDRDPT